MKNMILLFMSFSLGLLAQDTSTPTSIKNSDLRSGSVLIRIHSPSMNEHIVFIEKGNQVDVTKNNKILKLSTNKVQEFDQSFVEKFISFKYENPRNKKSKCKSIYDLYMRGEEAQICDDEQRKLVQLKYYINKLDR